ncbi:thiolase family protein, partial [Cribrihabitans sp. XS_ASV171]
YSRRPLRYRTYPDGRAPERYEQARFTPWADRDPDMAVAADTLGNRLAIAREAQDGWAIDSHAKAIAATRSLPELVDMAGLDRDPFSRALTQAHCRRAPRVHGDITAANMAVAADGAAFVLVVSDRVARKKSLSGVQIAGGCTVGGSPDMPGLAPVDAINRTLHAANLTPGDMRHVEIMEAFAVQAIACQQGAGLRSGLVNQKGGALARGHPVGASGTILATRLVHAIQARPGYGLAAIAAAGGLGTALLLQGD